MMDESNRQWDMKQEPLLTIGTVARMFELHQQTLREYEREGLIKPRRTAGGTRMYSPQDVERLRFILVLMRDMGVNLAGAEVVLRMQEQISEMERLMQMVLAQLDEPVRQRMRSFLEGSEFGLVRSGQAGQGLAVRKRIPVESPGGEEKETEEKGESQ